MRCSSCINLKIMDNKARQLQRQKEEERSTNYSVMSNNVS